MATALETARKTLVIDPETIAKGKLYYQGVIEGVPVALDRDRTPYKGVASIAKLLKKRDVTNQVRPRPAWGTAKARIDINQAVPVLEEFVRIGGYPEDQFVLGAAINTSAVGIVFNYHDLMIYRTLKPGESLQVYTGRYPLWRGVNCG